MSLLDTTHAAVAKRLDTLDTGAHVSVAVDNDDLDAFLDAVETRYGDDITVDTRPVASQTTQVKLTRS